MHLLKPRRVRKVRLLKPRRVRKVRKPHLGKPRKMRGEVRKPRKLRRVRRVTGQGALPYHSAMLKLKCHKRVIAAFLLLPLLFSVAVSQLLLPTTAHALDTEPPPYDTAPPYVIVKELPKNTQNPVAIIYYPNLTWAKLKEGYLQLDEAAKKAQEEQKEQESRSLTDTETTQSVQSAQTEQDVLPFLDKGALANLSAPCDWGISPMLENSAIGYYRVGHSNNTAANLLGIQELIDNRLPKNCIVFVVTGAPFNGKAPATELTPVIVYGTDFYGYATSDITKRAGLITAADISLLVSSSASLDSPFQNATIKGSHTNSNTVQRIDHLHHKMTANQSILETKEAAGFAFLSLVFIAFALSTVLLFLGRRTQPGSRGAFIPAIRILWLVVLAFPIATFFMFVFLPQLPHSSDLVFAMVLWVIAISLFALLIGMRSKWVNSLIALFSLSVIVLVAGQIFGGPLNSPGYLTYDITEGSRYYGMGNEQGAVLFGSWITLSGLLINRYPNASVIPAFKKWGYPLASAFLIFIASAPWFGASFGPLVWGFFGCAISWWLFNKWRLRWWVVLATIAASFALALGVLYIDLAFNPVSHMSQVVPIMDNGLLAVISRLASDVWRNSFFLINGYIPPVLIVFVFFIFMLLVVLRVLQPGSYRAFWKRNVAFRAAYSVCFAIAMVTLLIEDSGIFTPAILLIYPTSCFVWLVCDLHSWHLRVLEKSSAPVTMRELQSQSFELPSVASKEYDNLVGASASQQNVEVFPIGSSVTVVSTATAETSVGTAFETTSEASIAVVSAVAESANTDPDDDDKNKPSLAKSTATMSVATLLSRVTGLIRTVVMAIALGNTLFTSEYYIANNLPNMLYELVAGGVLTTAFLPIYLAQLQKRGKEGAASYSSNILSISAIILGFVVIAATVFAPQVIFTQTFATPNLNVANATFFFRFFAIQIIFYGMGAIITGLLNAHRKFLWPALGPVFNNVVLIITLLGYPLIAPHDPFVAKIWLAVGTTLGVVAMFAVQLPALAKLKISLRFHIDLKDPALVDTLKLALPVVAFIVFNIIAFSVMNAFALAVTNNGPSTISFAWLWYQLPYGVIAVALSTALLTEMSKASAAGDWQSFRNNVRLGLRTTLFLIIPLAAIILTLSVQLAGLYHAGEFTSQDVLAVAQLVAMWCIALPFYATYMFIYRVFTAKRDLKRFIIIDAMGRVLQITLYGFFTTGFGSWKGLGLVGIPLADACVYALLCAIMLYVLRKELGSFGLTEIVRDGIKILIAAVAAILVPYAILISSNVLGSPLLSFALIALFGTYSLVVFYLICRLLKVPETQMINRLASRIKGMIRRNK